MTGPSIQQIMRGINLELVPAFEEKLRAALADKDRDWLVDQIVRLTLDAHALQQIDRKAVVDAKAKARAERQARVNALSLGLDDIRAFLAAHESVTREGLIESGHLAADAPAKGTALITSEHRTEVGDQLLSDAKDMLFALLFADSGDFAELERTEHELLTMAVPRFKAGALDFMQAATELNAAGTWQDPDSVSNDERADNVLLEVQFGEIEGELVGKAIITALSLINNLEVNEQILYARMINVEETSLIV